MKEWDALFCCQLIALFSCQLIALFSCQLIAPFSLQLIALFSLQLIALFSLQLIALFSLQLIALFSWCKDREERLSCAKKWRNVWQLGGKVVFLQKILVIWQTMCDLTGQ